MIQMATASSHFKTRLTGWFSLISGTAIALYIARTQTFDQYPEGLDFLFPGLIVLVLLPVGACLAFGSSNTPPRNEENAPSNSRLFAKIAVLAWGYVGLIGLTGFPIATFAFQLAILGLIFNKRSLIWLIGIPTIATIAFTLFFSVGLSVPLPRGVGIFYTINALII